MSTVEEIERVIDRLPAEDFARLSAWLDQRQQARSTRCTEGRNAGVTLVSRGHSAFLSSYAPEDERLDDDAAHP